jgi:hypothetical protein
MVPVMINTCRMACVVRYRSLMIHVVWRSYVRRPVNVRTIWRNIHMVAAWGSMTIVSDNWSVNIYSVMCNVSCDGPRGIAHMHCCNRSSDTSFHICSVWSTHIPRIVVNACVVDYRCLIDDRNILRPVHIVVMNLRRSNISHRNKTPAVCRNNSYRNTHTWSQWRPAVIVAAAAPANPGRSPFVTWNPDPAVFIRIGPATVVERRPAPTVIGEPGPAIICICPVTSCFVRNKSRSIADPNLAVTAIVYPSSVRSQSVIENVYVYILCSQGIVWYCRDQ